MWQLLRMNANRTVATDMKFPDAHTARKQALEYLSYDLTLPVRISFEGKFRRTDPTTVYSGEEGIIQLKIELGMIPDEDLILYGHINDQIDQIIADRMRGDL
jgi:hypothetical protein